MRATGRGEYSYLIGSEVTRADRIPKGLAVVRIPAQTYAVFTAAGQMPDAVLGVWNTLDFELYDARFTRSDKKEAEVYVAIDDVHLKGME